MRRLRSRSTIRRVICRLVPLVLLMALTVGTALPAFAEQSPGEQVPGEQSLLLAPASSTGPGGETVAAGTTAAATATFGQVAVAHAATHADAPGSHATHVAGIADVPSAEVPPADKLGKADATQAAWYVDGLADAWAAGSARLIDSSLTIATRISLPLRC